jgi:Gamma-glutamyl cyclotransferase, AIG2-like
MDATVALFSYGSLRQPEVQLGTYGRLVETENDVLPGHVLTDIVIDDPHVVSLSGKSVHTIARPTGDPADRVAGVVLFLTDAELHATDRYEADPYARTEATLASGRRAFVYVDASSLGG